MVKNILYWKDISHPIIEKLYNNNSLNLFDDYPVENFHSLIRRNISSKVTAFSTLITRNMIINLLEPLSLENPIYQQNQFR